ncbi:amino acid permease, partial [Enterococcus faecalis]
PFSADILNFVIILVLFSSIDTGVYASSRLLYFLLKDKKGPMSKHAVLNKHQVPQCSVFFSASVLYLYVIHCYFDVDELFG